MLGARLKSWMEAQLGRAKKRKQKQTRQSVAPSTGPLPPPHLSSPESAYSTGYSTDGTSPGAAPAPLSAPLAAPLVAPPPPPAPPTTHLYHEPAKRRSSATVRRCIPEPPICATPSPRPRCRIRTNPWLGGTSPNGKKRTPHLFQQQSLQCPPPPQFQLQHAPYSLDSHKYGSRSPHMSPHVSPHLSPHLSPEPYRSSYYRGGVSSDEEGRGVKGRGRETAILSDADVDSDGDTGLDGGDEDEPDSASSPSRRRARRRRPPRRPPRSAGATPPRMRRRFHAPPPPPVRERDPLMEADREAERKYRELIREAEKLLVTVSRAPIEPPHNPRIRELRATEVEAPRRSPERTHVTNFIRANSPEPPRRLSPVARRSPLAAPPPTNRPPIQPLSPHDRPHSEPPKRKAYARDEVLQTLESLRKSLKQQSALLAVQRTRLDSL
ncbi:serine/arginine repetitive matrix protein 1-like isoform X1 [Vanessa tameamea]|uniref:Serine/arginine repetitive matrix protein 1-like isoform X1 n=1 Tax=Vanessa tameamea TaxID=334116 RepID=A0A8B8IHK2_VANTA|nr:serine/arginine repetitive matrix protein 1-like isoform X1 [Vanessa tameamea]